jgi:hypothetical protein
MTHQRPARKGEFCTCGRPAAVVFLGGAKGDTGWCGRSDGGEKHERCPFCGAGPACAGRCEEYRVYVECEVCEARPAQRPDRRICAACEATAKVAEHLERALGLYLEENGNVRISD